MIKPGLLCLLKADNNNLAIGGTLGLWTLGVAFTFTPTISGPATAPYTWSITSGSLPGWASLNTSTGVITGTPTDSADVTVTLHLLDNVGLTSDRILSLQQHDAHISSVVALLKMNGTHNSTTIVDAVGLHSWTTHGHAKLTTADQKFGSASLTLDATAGTYIEAASDVDWKFGTGDFTVEMWIKTAAAVSTDQGIFTVGIPSGFSMGLQGSSGGGLFAGPVNVSYGPVGAAPSTGVWTHVAACRASGTIRVFLNGTLSNSASDSTDYQQNFADCGASNGGLGYVALFNGLQDEMRVTKGFARYTSTFTPSGFPFPAQ